MLSIGDSHRVQCEFCGNSIEVRHAINLDGREFNERRGVGKMPDKVMHVVPPGWHEGHANGTGHTWRARRGPFMRPAPCLPRALLATIAIEHFDGSGAGTARVWLQSGLCR